MIFKTALLVFLPILSCQGPWSYYPDDPENYAGIWTNAYIVSGRPVEDVCFDKMHPLTETRMPGFAFYDEASVKIMGTFNGKDDTLFLEPKIGKPNCFVGPSDLLVEAGKNYEMDISMVWDSAGKKVTSNFNAKTSVPQKFKIQRAYDLMGKEFSRGETIQYLPPPLDLKAAYFVPEYSDEVAIVQVTMVYNDDVYWGENSIDKLVEKFVEEGADTARKAKFGDREHVWFARNQEVAGNPKDIDSIPIIGITMPAQGQFQLLFYATTNDYARYRETYLDAENDSRVQAVYNINGGAGIFAGMLVDTFDVHIAPLSQDIKLYSYFDAQSAYCREDSRDYNVERYRVRSECAEVWDSVIWCEIENGKPTDESVCLGESLDPRPWYEIPPEEIKKLLTVDEIVTWCEHRFFPIEQYPLCGSAMVRFSKGKNSAILASEVKKWCEENEYDAECS